MSDQVTHLDPGQRSWKLPCCKRFIFFLPDNDLVTTNPLAVTCEGADDV